MIKAYEMAVQMYRKARQPFFIWFLCLFAITFLMVSSGRGDEDLPGWILWQWYVMGSAMILFAFIMAVLHMMVGRKLRGK